MPPQKWKMKVACPERFRVREASHTAHAQVRPTYDSYHLAYVRFSIGTRVVSLATSVSSIHLRGVPSKNRIRGKRKRERLAVRAASAAAYVGLDKQARDWLITNPNLAHALLEQEEDRKWRNARKHISQQAIEAIAAPPPCERDLELDEEAEHPATRLRASTRGRRSSASKGAVLLAAGTRPKPKEQRHIERALHDQLIARLFADVHAFYDNLRTVVPRTLLDAILMRIAAYYSANDSNAAHPLRGTPLLRDASRIGRAASRSMVHMKGERGKAPSPATTRLMGTALGILCGGESARVWTTATTRLASGVAANVGTHTGRMLRTSIDLLARKYLDIAYTKGAHHAALAFTGKLVGRSKGGVTSSLTRATVSPS